MKFVTEIPKNSNLKYEIKNGILTLDRVIDVQAPHNYGYIEGTLEDDGDPLDAFLILPYPLIPGTVVEASPFTGFECIDQGVKDNKLILFPKFNSQIIDLNDDLPITTIEYYLKTYKKGFEVIRQLNFTETAMVYQKAATKTYKDL